MTAKPPRRYDEAGCCQGDTLALEAEVAAGAPLLEQVMHQGQRLRPSPSLDEVRRYTRAQLASLPPALRGLDPAPPTRCGSAHPSVRWPPRRIASARVSEPALVGAR